MPRPSLLIAPRSAAALLLLALASVSPAQSRPNRDPERARLITEDIPRFWAAYDARSTLGAASAFDSIYLRPGSRGLRDFTKLRITDATTLARTVASAERYYASIRASTERVATQDSTIRTAFRRLKALHADAVFPDVYFVVGRMTSGGTTSDAGLLIGVEMYGRTTDSALAGLSAWHRDVLAPVERLPAIVAHELCHYQQTSRRNETLLARALREGMCDFVSELTAGAQINEVATAYGLAHEHALWEEFRAQMDDKSIDRWLYGGRKSPDRPADLGYFIGNRISRAYYERAPDKAAALRTLFSMKDPRDILAASGYAP